MSNLDYTFWDDFRAKSKELLVQCETPDIFLRILGRFIADQKYIIRREQPHGLKVYYAIRAMGFQFAKKQEPILVKHLRMQTEEQEGNGAPNGRKMRAAALIARALCCDRAISRNHPLEMIKRKRNFQTPCPTNPLNSNNLGTEISIPSIPTSAGRANEIDEEEQYITEEDDESPQINDPEDSDSSEDEESEGMNEMRQAEMEAQSNGRKQREEHSKSIKSFSTSMTNENVEIPPEEEEPNKRKRKLDETEPQKLGGSKRGLEDTMGPTNSDYRVQRLENLSNNSRPKSRSTIDGSLASCVPSRILSTPMQAIPTIDLDDGDEYFFSLLDHRTELDGFEKHNFDIHTRASDASVTFEIVYKTNNHIKQELSAKFGPSTSAASIARLPAAGTSQQQQKSIVFTDKGATMHVRKLDNNLFIGEVTVPKFEWEFFAGTIKGMCLEFLIDQ